MISDSQALVHHLLAVQLQTSDEAIEDAQGLDDLGLDPLDLVLFVLRLEEWAGGHDEFPLLGLDHAETVADLVALVDLWCSTTLPSGSHDEGPRSRSAA
jgi:acyl carrier protein